MKMKRRKTRVCICRVLFCMSYSLHFVFIFMVGLLIPKIPFDFTVRIPPLIVVIVLAGIMALVWNFLAWLDEEGAKWTRNKGQSNG